MLIRTCCIGDVVLATAALEALHNHYPDATIDWAVGSWSRQIVEAHPLVNHIVDTGSSALPVKTVTGFYDFVKKIRKGRYDLAVSLVRSPLMSMAVLLSGIPYRVGLDSNGRGFGYNLRTPVNPDEAKHEALIYLDVMRTLGIDTSGIYPTVPVSEAVSEFVHDLMLSKGIHAPYIVVNPAGGSNPGMELVSKRYPLHQLAKLAEKLSERYQAQPVIVGGPTDQKLVDELQTHFKSAPVSLCGDVSMLQIGAMARDALMYVGNDTGLTHLAAACDAYTVMLMGPSDPERYAPYSEKSIAVWKAWDIHKRGVAEKGAVPFDWSVQGVQVDEAYRKITDFIDENKNHRD